MTSHEFKVLAEMVDTIQRSLDRLDRDLSQDRQDIQQLTIRIGAMEGEVDGMRKSLSGLATKVRDNMEDVVQPLTEVIEKKRAVRVQARPWWKKLWKG